MGIEGNEAADREAGEGAKGTDLNLPPTLAAVRAAAQKALRNAFPEWWRANEPASYRRLKLGIPAGRPRELNLARAMLHRLLAERSGHGDFESYHERFGHEPGPPCRCGQPKAVDHFAVCQKALTQGPQNMHWDLRRPDRLLGSGWEIFARWVERSGAYKTLEPG